MSRRESGDPDAGARRFWPAFGRGMLLRCPRCGRGRLFAGYLKVRPACMSCEGPLHHHQADDAPPYFTMMIVGHLVVGLALWAEISYAPPIWMHAVLWLPLALALSLLLLPAVKGAIVATQWALRMHGFSGPDDGGTA